MGIRSLIQMNRALHGKWYWRYLCEGVRQWKHVIEVGCGSWDGRAERGGCGGKYSTGFGRRLVKKVGTSEIGLNGRWEKEIRRCFGMILG